MDLGVYIIVHCGRWGGSITKRQTAQNQNVANNSNGREAENNAGMAELADARDLKSFEGITSCGFDSRFRQKTSRGGAIWKLVGLITRRLPVRIRPPQPESRAA